MNLSIRDVKRLFTAGIKAEFERTHDPRLEDADAVCAASLTEICRQAAARRHGVHGGDRHAA